MIFFNVWNKFLLNFRLGVPFLMVSSKISFLVVRSIFFFLCYFWGSVRVWVYILRLLVNIVCVLISMAFFTLIERKLLGYIQMRKGPNKVGLVGLPQPLADALKLFKKEQIHPRVSNFFPYLLSPVFRLIFSLVVWIVYPYAGINLYMLLGVVFFLCVIRLNVYGTIIAGWGSNSKYALLGALRAVAQTISYEVRLILILLGVLILFTRYDFFGCCFTFKGFWVGVVCVPLTMVWVVSRIAETNRAPFDFAEGESELVSGFNIEYRRGRFALIFMAEYTSILGMRIVTVVIFLGGSIIRVFYFGYYLKIGFVALFFVWVRGAYPRYRYDLLMKLAWKVFLPLGLYYLLFVLIFRCFYF